LPTRVIVYFDWQNCYKSALENFPRGCSGTCDPLKTASGLARKVLPGASADRQLEKVKIYRGLPNARKDPRTNAAAQKQKTRWETGAYAGKVEVHTRPLAYRTERLLDDAGAEILREVGREKGVDVELAVDLVRDMLFTDPPAGDVAVVFSEDSDFHPAYEMLLEARGKDVLEIARWRDRDAYAPKPFEIRGHTVRQHLLDHVFFKSVEDKTAY
jgi:uncharacterized LabA/DUF88 family protein